MDGGFPNNCYIVGVPNCPQKKLIMADLNKKRIYSKAVG